MLLRKQDLCTLFLYYLGYARISAAISRFKGSPVVRFLTFHDIPDHAHDSFRKNISFLASKTNVISLDDYCAGRISSNKINTVVTFDDGYKSWLTTAAPIMKAHGVSATFFISSGFLNLSPSQEAEFVKSNLKADIKTTGCLTREDVLTLAKDGFIIGGHTRTHVNLGEMKNAEAIRSEIEADKQTLEKITGNSVSYFAYPFGAFHNPGHDLAALLRGVGYSAAVTTVSGNNPLDRNRYLLRRELTGAPMPLSVFKARATGVYDGVMTLKRLAGAA